MVEVLLISNALYTCTTHRNTRKQLSKTPVTREDIKTVSKYDLQRSQKKKDMVAGSKRRKTELQEL